MNRFFKEKQELDTSFYSRQIFPAVHIADFKLTERLSYLQKKEEPPSVAIVMPVFNTNQYFLKEAIVSVLKNQTYKGPLILVIVDDGSSDPKTVSMLNSCKEQHDNVVLHRLKHNCGLPNALNVGF
jgi:cellulose synthase/poly-beta-1,6-N-acetylglucosamine synthase-like glycosyltransferase